MCHHNNVRSPLPPARRVSEAADAAADGVPVARETLGGRVEPDTCTVLPSAVVTLRCRLLDRGPDGEGSTAAGAAGAKPELDALGADGLGWPLGCRDVPPCNNTCKLERPVGIVCIATGPDAEAAELLLVMTDTGATADTRG